MKKEGCVGAGGAGRRLKIRHRLKISSIDAKAQSLSLRGAKIAIVFSSLN
jgi:hypothetical protein